MIHTSIHPTLSSTPNYTQTNNDLLPPLREQMHKHIFPLNVTNAVNPNLQAGVVEQVCLEHRFCPDVWKHHID